MTVGAGSAWISALGMFVLVLEGSSFPSDVVRCVVWHAGQDEPGERRYATSSLLVLDLAGGWTRLA